MAATQKSVVFGASGPVGHAVLSKLASYTDVESITALTRSGKLPTIPGTERLTVKKADVLDKSAVLAACTGATAIFCCVGLKYNARMWQRDWPIAVDNLLAAAQANVGSVLVFTDNVYCFGPEPLISGKPLLESSTDFTAHSGMPGTRAIIERQLLAAENCNVAIVRAADFYGPGVTVSQLGADMFKAIAKGKAAQLISKPDQPHSFAYVPDFAAALVAVARRGAPAWNRAWHVPHAEAESLASVLDRIAILAGTGKARTTLVPVTGVLGAVIKLFVPVLHAVAAMSYQFEHPLIVDSREFDAEFGDLGLPTPLDVGLKATLDACTCAPTKT